MEQLDLIDEPGWRRDQRYEIKYPPAVEVLKRIEPNPDRHIMELCLEGLKAAVAEGKMSKEKARENFINWFGVDVNFHQK